MLYHLWFHFLGDSLDHAADQATAGGFDMEVISHLYRNSHLVGQPTLS